MMLRFYICCFLLVVVALPVPAQAGPACLPQDSVPEIADNPSHGWLTHEGKDVVKAHFEKIAGNANRHWDGDTLIMACAVGGPPAYDMTAVTVEGGSGGEMADKYSRTYFSNLARNTGHTQQEADVLYNKYAQLHGTYYKQVPDGQGRKVNESDAILKRHEKKLGIQPPAAPASASGDKKQRAAELKKKIDAAKKRGDMNEVMRLAGEAQQMSAPMAAESAAITKQTDQQAWALYESAFPELVQAAFRTRISGFRCPCLQCDMP